MAFQTVFKQVDVDNDGTITGEDLRRYAVDNNLDEDKFVKKWLSLFDHNQDGIIHEEEFLRVIGGGKKVRPSIAPPLESKNNVEIFRADMSNELQEDVIKICQETLSQNPNNPHKATSEIQATLNSTKGTYWHVEQDPSSDDHIDYDTEGMIFFTPNGGATRLMVYRCDRQAPRRVIGLCCC